MKNSPKNSFSGKRGNRLMNFNSMIAEPLEENETGQDKHFAKTNEDNLILQKISEDEELKQNNESILSKNSGGIGKTKLKKYIN